MPGPETSGFDESSFHVDNPATAPETIKVPGEQPADTEATCEANVLSPDETHRKELAYRAWEADLGWPWDSDD